MRISFKSKALSIPSMVLIICCAALFIWNFSASNNHVICIKDCGEGFIAQHQVQNFRLYGFKHLLMEDHATSNDETQHTYFYTHNVNIGAISYQLLDSLGIKSFTLKQVFTLLIFSLGMLYVYLATSYCTGSKLIAFFTLLFSITDVNQILSFALNPLRAWHWLAIFGIVYHVAKFAHSTKISYLNLVAILIFLGAAFGIGYEFFGICVVLSLATLLANSQIFSKNTLKRLIIILGLASIPFMLRQAQVAWVLGLHYWAQDFFYSFVIKIPHIVKIFPLDFNEIDQFYASYNVLRPPASAAGSVTFQMNLDLFIKLVKSVTLNESGYVSIIISCLIFAVSLVLVAGHKIRFLGQSIHGYYLSNNQKSEIYKASCLYLTLIISILIGLCLFLPFSLHVYLKHQFPLIAVPLHIAKAILVVYLIFIATSSKVSRSIKLLLALFCMFMLIDHALIHIFYADKENKIDTGWAEELKKEPNATYAVSWIPSTAAGYVNNWVVGIKPGSERIIADNFNSNRNLFSANELFLFGQKTNGDLDKFLKPDYWLYFQSDNSNPIDFPSLKLPQDYLLKSINRLANKNINMSHTWISKPECHIGETILFGGNLDAKGYNIKQIIVQDSMSNTLNSFDSRLSPLESNYVQFNANTGLVYAEYTIPREYTVSSVTDDENIEVVNLYVSAILDNNTKQLIWTQPLRINKSKIINNGKFNGSRQQPSVNQLIESMPNLPIKAQGKNYVIFDIRNVK